MALSTGELRVSLERTILMSTRQFAQAIQSEELSHAQILNIDGLGSVKSESGMVKCNIFIFLKFYF